MKLDKKPPRTLPAGLDRDPPDLEALAALQGVKPVERFEDLLGDFWPEGESVEDFLAVIDEIRSQTPDQERGE